MIIRKRLALFIITVIAGIGFFLGQALAETVYVQGKTAKLRAGKTSLDRVVADLRFAEPLEVLRKDGTWFEVRTAAGVSGWIFANKTTATKPSGQDDELA
ncbi:MAG TPA: SH3 domain-containing protein, partial [Nitrospirales bacterium]|nr:SH3 domain-containing protein [Nitrospirales bacterium]